MYTVWKGSVEVFEPSCDDENARVARLSHDGSGTLLATISKGEYAGILLLFTYPLSKLSPRSAVIHVAILGADIYVPLTSTLPFRSCVKVPQGLRPYRIAACAYTNGKKLVAILAGLMSARGAVSRTAADRHGVYPVPNHGAGFDFGPTSHNVIGRMALEISIRSLSLIPSVCIFLYEIYGLPEFIATL